MNIEMSSKNEIVKNRFAEELTRCCGRHFKTIPSNEQFARDFYLSSKHKLKVSREAVRKWFRGETFPDLDYFLHLIEWLHLDISNIFPSKVVDNLKKLPVHIQYLNVEGAEQITSNQIDFLISLLSEIKKTNNLDYRSKEIRI